MNLRRYFTYVEHSLSRGAQWAAFEPKGERAMGERPTVENPLLSEWVTSVLLGDKPRRPAALRFSGGAATQGGTPLRQRLPAEWS